MSWQSKVLSLCKKYGSAAKFATTTVLGAVVPGSPAVISLVEQAFDAAQQVGQDDWEIQVDKHLQTTADNQVRLEQILEVLGGDLQDILDELAHLKQMPRQSEQQLAQRVEEVLADARANREDWQNVSRKLDGIALRFDRLEQQGAELLHGQRHATGMLEEMLPLVRHLATGDTTTRLSVTAVTQSPTGPTSQTAKAPSASEPIPDLSCKPEQITNDFLAYEKLACLYGNTNSYTWLKKQVARVPAWRSGAERGIPAAMVLYAECLINSVGVASDLLAAEKMLRHAAQLGLHSALTFLGEFNVSNHEGRPADEIAAFSWYRKAAEAGNVHGIYSVGVCYSHGTGTAKNEQEAVKWYQRAMELGSSAAMYRISYAYHNGEGVPQDDRLGNHWLERAANAGCLHSMWSLGSNYEHGYHGLTKDLKKAHEWYLKGARAGCTMSMSALASIYKYGKGVEQNYAEAIKWFLQKGEAGSGQGHLWAGELYLKGGYGVTQDYAAAVRCFEKAVLDDFTASDALLYLGRLYYFGGPVLELDRRRSRDYLEQAVAKGNEEAKAYLDHRENWA